MTYIVTAAEDIGRNNPIARRRRQPQRAGRQQARDGAWTGCSPTCAAARWRCRCIAFSFARNAQSIAAKAALDGLYVIRTSVAQDTMAAAGCVRNDKALAKVERAFRSMKTVDLKVRPIHHRPPIGWAPTSTRCLR